MELNELPPDLLELEALLKTRNQPTDDANVRARILDGIKRELARQNVPRATGAWRFAAGFAAALFLGANLSMSAVNNMEWNWDAEKAPRSIPTVEEQIRKALPELSESDVRQHARLIVYSSR